MASGPSNFAFTAPTSNFSSTTGPAGGSASVTLPEISVGPDLPGPGSGGGALPGDGSYGDPIAGFRQINQQFADGQRAFSEAIANRSNEINAGFQAQNEARNAQIRAQSDANFARMNADRAALFAAPAITGPLLPPNFAETAQVPPTSAPLPPAEPLPAAAGAPPSDAGGPTASPGADIPAPPVAAAPTGEPPPTDPSAAPPPQTPSPDFSAPAAGDELAFRGGILPFGRTVDGDIVPAWPEFLVEIGRAIAYPGRVLSGEVTIYDPATGQISDEAIASGLALGGLGMTGGFAGVARGTGETLLGAGPVRTSPASPPVRGGLAGADGRIDSTRPHPDGSLRTPDGKFASVSGVAAPGTANARQFADFLRTNGVDVVGMELEVSGPLGVRRYDIVTRNPDGTLHGIEVKSGGATSGPYQRFTDMFINLLGAEGRGQINGQRLTGTTKVYLPAGGMK